MIDHLSITTTDLDRAQAFHDAVLGALGYPRVNRRPDAIGYGARECGPEAPAYISVYLSTGTFSPDHYAAFVRDPDGNLIEAVTRRPEE